MPTPETMSGTTAAQRADPHAGMPPRAMQFDTPRVSHRVAPGLDAAEITLRRKARHQGLLLLIASSIAMIGLIVGIWLSFR